MSDFLFPDVGEGIHEAKVISWKVKEGDTVKADQVLVEVETDKAVVEIPSPKAGIIEKLNGAVGTVIKVGSVLVTFAEGARAPDTGTVKVEANLVPALPTNVPEAKPITPVANPTTAVPPNRVLAAPATRKLARERNIALSSIKGSGPYGRITRQDVLAATQAPKAETPRVEAVQARPTQVAVPVAKPAIVTQQATPVQGSAIPYSGRRKAIGEHMIASHAAPAVVEFAQADVTALSALREHAKARAEKAGVKLTPLPFFVKALGIVLRKYPIMNSVLKDDSIILMGDINIGIAVDAPKGLVVPVVRGVDRKSVFEIAQEITTLADGARADTLTLEQMRGSTCSVSSIGPLRVQGFTPMLNSPETAILGIGAIQDTPWVVDGAVAVRKVVTLSLT